MRVRMAGKAVSSLFAVPGEAPRFLHLAEQAAGFAPGSVRGLPGVVERRGAAELAAGYGGDG
jgi:hypothetical protein